MVDEIEQEKEKLKEELKEKSPLAKISAGEIAKIAGYFAANYK